ncbi:MAG: hypothetical protein JAY90_20115 [Candidatus Thiodiazotropha lotti]|nr:hypothetical protein [Candidatus Thiodiazotropha lotti]
MAVKYELMVANGTYQKEGQQKTSWLKIGRIMSKQNGGFAMKIDCTPTSVIDRDGNQVAWDGWVQMFEPQPRENSGQQQAAPQPAPAGDDFSDDIPFNRIVHEYLV